MPRKGENYPSLRRHPKGHYFTWDNIRKKQVCLGTDLDRARERWEELRRENVSPPLGDLGEREEKLLGEEITRREISVAELLAAWLRHRRAEGADARSLGRTKAAIRFAKLVGEDEPAKGFRALKLQAVRDRMLKGRSRRHKAHPDAAQPLSRRYINHLVADLKAAWTWAASQEMIPAETAMSLQTVKALRTGKGGRETKRIRQVEPWAVEATLPHLNPIVADMVRLQLLAGCRPGELCRLRPMDISSSPKSLITIPGTDRDVGAMQCGETLVWIAVPGSHKTIWKGKPRAIVLSPSAQKILSPYLDRPSDKPLFSPKEASDASRRARGCKLIYAADRMPGERYTTQSYGKAIAAAIKRANKARREADSEATLIPNWRPNQLRKARGSEVSEKFDRPTAAAYLGHAGIDVIDVYVDQELSKAAWAAAKLG